MGRECKRPLSDFQKWSFHILKRRPRRCWHFIIMFTIFLAAAAVSNHLHVVSGISSALWYCFKGMWLVRIFSLRGPQ